MSIYLLSNKLNVVRYDRSNVKIIFVALRFLFDIINCFPLFFQNCLINDLFFNFCYQKITILYAEVSKVPHYFFLRSITISLVVTGIAFR